MKIYTILFFSILISLSSCRSNSDTNPQTKLNTAVATLHTDLEKAISTDVPSLSVYVISPKGTYFSSVTGKTELRSQKTLISGLQVIPKISPLQLF